MLTRNLLCYCPQFIYFSIRKFVVYSRQLPISQFVNSWFRACNLFTFQLKKQSIRTLKHRFIYPKLQRGISLIVLPLPSERVGERLLFPHSVLSNTPEYLAICSPSPFGEGRGEAVSGVLQAVSGVFQAFEIPLQTVRCYCSQINLL